MHPLVPYILGEEHPAGKRLVNVQKCIRTGDIDEVGDSNHLTFFEMLGNWSLGDYFKEEAISMSWEFLTSTDWLGINPEKLAVTIFAGDEDAPRDTESAELWRNMGVPEDRIFYLPKKDNWWGPPGKTGPCGPDTEIFIDTGIPGHAQSRPGINDGKWLEIWNNVFMQYRRTDDERILNLERVCVDTGMGVERTITILQGKKSVYETELFSPIIDKIQELSTIQYGGSENNTDRSFRIISDHLRTSCFILGDQQAVRPSNIGQGYILRRLIRRSIRHGLKLGLPEGFLSELSKTVIEIYSDVYPELQTGKNFIQKELTREEERFTKTLRHGEQEFEKMLPNLLKSSNRIIPGRIVFKLYDTYGFPLELSEELAGEHGLSIDKEGFERAFRRHQELSKTDAKATFKGGLADHGEKTTALHTATHLLHEALRRILGDHVAQKGSNITPDRLRFDFSHSAKLSPEELRDVEELVNEQIKNSLPVKYDSMALDDARKIGARALFGEKYDNTVKVYSIGDFSKEVCGGPHAENTAQLGQFKITKEQSSSQGVRRIKAILIHK
ncbi:MAG: alanine--tRNA ligase, partial [Salinispira sp.]